MTAATLTTPTVVTTAAELVHGRTDTRASQVVFVPTMGALHEGHATLMRHARQLADTQPGGQVVVSIFVNPTQFAPDEDLDRYPRTLGADLQVCADAGVDVVFAPGVDELYPAGDTNPDAQVGITVDPGPLGHRLEGAARPTHFRGVLTVVSKLFGLVQPDIAIFGEKDYQQLVLLRQMARSLCMPVQVIGVPTVREADGLALSSRNRYLSPTERTRALGLSAALFAAAGNAAAGAEVALSSARQQLEAHGLEVDYLELTDPDLGPAPAQGAARLLVAARVGTTRLIDNIALTLEGEF